MLRTLLIGPGLDGHPPLFRSGSEIATQVADLKEITLGDGEVAKNKFYGRLNTATSYINQSLRDGTPFSHHLGLAVLAVVDLRLAGILDRRVAEKWRSRIRAAMGLEKIPELLAPFPDLEDLQEAILRLAEKSTDHCIVSSELYQLDVCGELFGFRDFLVRRLALLEPGEFKAPTCRYTFVVPNLEAARTSWQSLFVSLVSESTNIKDGRPTAETIDGRLSALDERGALRIYAVDSHLCVLPMICLEPGQREATALNTYLVDGRLSALPIPAAYLRLWSERVYMPIVNGLFGTMVRYRDIPRGFVQDSISKENMTKVYGTTLP